MIGLRYSDGFLFHKNWASPIFLCYSLLSCMRSCYVFYSWLPEWAGPQLPARHCCAQTLCPAPACSPSLCELGGSTARLCPLLTPTAQLRGQEELCPSSLRLKARKYFGLKILPLSIQGCPREVSHSSTVFRARKRRNWFHIIMPFSSYHMGTIRNHIFLSSP